MDIVSEGKFLRFNLSKMRLKKFGRQYQIRTGDLLDVDQAL